MRPEILYSEPRLIGSFIEEVLSEEEIQKYRSLNPVSMSDAEKKEWSELDRKASDAVRELCASSAVQLYGWPVDSEERDPTHLSFDILESEFSLPENVIKAPDGTRYRSCIGVPEGAIWVDGEILMAGRKPLCCYEEHLPRWLYGATFPSKSGAPGPLIAYLGRFPDLKMVSAYVEVVTLVMRTRAQLDPAAKEIAEKWKVNPNTLREYMKESKRPQWAKELYDIMDAAEASSGGLDEMD